jgi:hypothetical protein
MNGTRDTNETATPDGGEEFGPHEAAALLEQTEREARRKLDPFPPLLSLINAVAVAVAYGAVWLSVRDQHPYQGPNGAALAVLYIVVIAVSVVSGRITTRAYAGVRGRSRPRPAESVVLATAWIAVFVFQGALYHAGLSHAIVYGIWPATGPLIVVGLTGAALAAARSNWPVFGAAMTMAVIATGAAYAGPAGAWLVAGAGLSAALLVHGAIRSWQRRVRL